jgi:hypothetical protein
LRLEESKGHDENNIIISNREVMAVLILDCYQH